jgi:hypothetical protein
LQYGLDIVPFMTYRTQPVSTAFVTFIMEGAAWLHAVDGNRYPDLTLAAEVVGARYMADHAGCVVSREQNACASMWRVAEAYGLERREVRDIEQAFRLIAGSLGFAPSIGWIPSEELADMMGRR